jgi:DNA integrity scanning protein DisA with diadenylate cyclase activity
MFFNKTYFLLASALFITEVLIGIYMHDTVIRPYGGDFLVVVLIYCAVKSFFNSPVLQTALYVLIFAYVVEVSQYFHLVNLLGLQNNKMAEILLGTSFSITDLLAYTLGILLVIVIEGTRKRATRSLIIR